MLRDVKFSLPLWPGLSPDELTNVVIPTLQQARNVISDIYFTSRIAPFTSDAMGGIIVTDERVQVMSNALYVGQETGIPLSATFNNTIVNPKVENYITFVEEFTPLYNSGIRTVTIPFTTWMRFGLKEQFPDLFVKNTIINRVKEAAEVARLYEEGFDYINLDRVLIRNEDRLKEIEEARQAMQDKLDKKLYISLLVNEDCEGFCPVQDDHHNYNFQREEGEPSYFESQMRQTASCIIKDDHSSEYILKSSSIPMFYSQFDHYSKYVDVFKLHGRESKEVFYRSLDFVRRFAERAPLEDPFRAILTQIPEKSKTKFLNHIKNCKFNCWKCKMCDNIAEGKTI